MSGQDQQYTPSEARVCIDYCNAAVGRRKLDPSEGMAIADEEFTRFIAQVRRDAAMSTYAAAYRAGWLDGQNGSLPDPRMAYPEVAP